MRRFSIAVFRCVFSDVFPAYRRTGVTRRGAARLPVRAVAGKQLRVLVEYAPRYRMARFRVERVRDIPEFSVRTGDRRHGYEHASVAVDYLDVVHGETVVDNERRSGFQLAPAFPESVTLMSVMLIIISAPFSRCGGKIIAYLNPYFKRFSISNILNSSFPLLPPYVRTARRGAAYNSVCRILWGKGYISSG